MKIRTHGFAMIELMVAMALSTMLVVVAIGFSRSEAETQRATQAAAHLRGYVDAARNYIDANKPALLSGVGPTAHVVDPWVLQPHTAPGFNLVGPFGGGYTLHIRQAVPGRLDALLVAETTTPPTGLQARQMASRLGRGAGYVPAGGGGTAPSGNWTISPADLSSGWRANPASFAPLYALYFDDAEVDNSTASAAVLHRDRDNARPERNRMSTALDMGGHDVNATGVARTTVLDTRQANATEGVLANTIAIGRADWGGVPYAYETVQVPSHLTMRFYAGSQQLTSLHPSGITLHNNTHVQGAFSVAGNMNSGGQLHSDSLLSTHGETHVGGWIRSWGPHGWYSQTHGGGWHMTDPNWVRSYNDRGIYTGGTIQSGHMESNSATVNGNIHVGGNSYTGGSSTTAGNRTVHGSSWTGSRLSAHDFAPRRIEQCNVPCSETGVLSRTAAGQPVACVSGQWRCLSLASTGGGGGGTTPPPGGACMCPPGYSPYSNGCMQDSWPNQIIYCP